MFRTPMADAIAENMKIQSADETVRRMAETIEALRAAHPEPEEDQE